MKTQKLICIGCPMGCDLTVTVDGDNINVTGNTCKRGEDYAKKEVTKPKRVLTSSIKVEGGEYPVVSVRTNCDIDKDKLFECMKVIKETTVKAPVKIGDVLIKNILNTSADIIATKDINKVQEGEI